MIPLVPGYLDVGSKVVGYDPQANEAFRKALAEGEIAEDLPSAFA